MENSIKVKYKKIGFCIEVNLMHHLGYKVRANILKEHDEGKKETYSVTLELRHNEVERWDMMDGEIFSIVSENINFTVGHMILEKESSGYFDRFIKRYEYELMCFDKGCDLLDNTK